MPAANPPLALGKRTVVFVPGLGASGAVYEPLLRQLREKYDVRSADIPLEFPDELGWDFFLDSIDAVSRNAKEIYLLGHSLGGAVALKYAAEKPKRVKQVIAVAPVLLPSRQQRHRTLERLRNLIIAAVHLHLAHAYRAVKIMRARGAGGRAGRLYRWSHTIDLRLELPKLKRATIMWPKHEEVIPRRQFEELGKRHPNVTAIEVPGSHQTMSLAPEPLLPIIERELDG